MSKESIIISEKKDFFSFRLTDELEITAQLNFSYLTTPPTKTVLVYCSNPSIPEGLASFIGSIEEEYFDSVAIIDLDAGIFEFENNHDWIGALAPYKLWPECLSSLIRAIPIASLMLS